MTRKSWTDAQRLREEIALAAARLIAEEGADYATAKRKAAKQVTGETRIAGELLPDNDQIEAEVREYVQIFMSDTQPAELAHLREAALNVMDELARYRPYIAGAVYNGTATALSDIYLQAFCDNPKEVAIDLLNRGIDYEVSESRHFNGRGMVETLSFLWRQRGQRGDPAGVHLSLYSLDDMRGALKTSDGNGRPARTDANGLRVLMAAEAQATLTRATEAPSAPGTPGQARADEREH
ncbi:UDP-N-acetylmuramate--alanine ligase [Pandoraea sp. PE-S2R-1]|uniref:UDP-N-acetylmuramate--alanine ligase n=1 Tax=Pandoraea sp. PE-S2R-1 TaxID=1986994 RepID=UPI002016259A|nr:UDP-N-acetylmuramate--alanine ligase [Pandoraea sp. PE-S2R-1]